MTDTRAFGYPDELLEEEEFGRLVSFSKGLSDSATVRNSGDLLLGLESFPQDFGKFKLTRLLGENNFCRTFLASENETGQKMVVKKIHPRVVEKFSPGDFAAAKQKIHQESMTAASVAPELVTPIVAFGEVDGQHFYLMDFAKGKSLAKLTNACTLSNRLSAELVQSIADSVYKLHRAGIFLGNIHPANVILDNNQCPHLLETSLASLDRTAHEHSQFRAPETVSVEDVSAASEIWSLGAILYNCLAGEPPGKTVVSPRKRNKKVARDLETVCMKCLQQKPHQRYATMSELANDLDLFLEYQPVKASPPGILGKLVNRLSRLA